MFKGVSVYYFASVVTAHEAYMCTACLTKGVGREGWGREGGEGWRERGEGGMEGKGRE